jgi:putative iron-regulated protein
MRSARSCLVALAAFSLLGAGSPAFGQRNATASTAGVRSQAVVAKRAISDYATLVHATYASLVRTTADLQRTVDAFVAAPSASTHAAAKEAWIASRKVYGLTEAFRFYGGPIDDPKTGPEGFMNAWPLDESYVDGVKDAPGAGYVNNPKAFPDITRELLLSLNEKDGEKNISTGYHAIEFFLWGQDFSLKRPGNRTFSDYVDNGKNNAARRAKALSLLAAILHGHASALEEAWRPGVSGNYAATFVALPAEDAVQKMISGVAVLSVDEMAGERMIVALAKDDPENEQSCFSDTTHLDFVAGAQGISNVWKGEAKGLPGAGASAAGKGNPAGLRDVVTALDAKLATRIDAALARSASQLAKIPAPFDAVIASPKKSAGRNAAERAIASLEDQGKLFASAARVLGVEINVQE